MSKGAIKSRRKKERRRKEAAEAYAPTQPEHLDPLLELDLETAEALRTETARIWAGIRECAKQGGPPPHRPKRISQSDIEELRASWSWATSG